MRSVAAIPDPTVILASPAWALCFSNLLRGRMEDHARGWGNEGNAKTAVVPGSLDHVSGNCIIINDARSTVSLRVRSLLRTRQHASSCKHSETECSV